jgi:hypothetical protein
LPLQQHVDLKFLLFRLDFTEYYSRVSSSKWVCIPNVEEIVVRFTIWLGFARHSLYTLAPLVDILLAERHELCPGLPVEGNF